MSKTTDQNNITPEQTGFLHVNPTAQNDITQKQPTSKLSTTDSLNFQNIKESQAYHKSAVKQMIKAIIKKTPREILIEVLKEQKIIKQDWCAKGNKYVER